jgi:hypothetical protein
MLNNIGWGFYFLQVLLSFGFYFNFPSAQQIVRKRTCQKDRRIGTYKNTNKKRKSKSANYLAAKDEYHEQYHQSSTSCVYCSG